VVWKSTFKRAANAGADVDDAKARNIVAGIYLAGFDGLRKVLGETAQAAR
jgi:mxaD protein